jgi:D-alanyl-lipoteichoic acid acyltransferase DltB (MBOAT superfamily)
MEITSLAFILLSTLSVFVYYLIPGRYRVLFLVLLSAGFVATFSYRLLLYVLAYTLLNYWIGIRIPEAGRKKALFITGIVLNLSQLVLLKYVTFTIEPLFRLFSIETDLTSIARFIVPIGVSYFTLQGIGYLVNVNLGWEKPEKNFLHFLLYMIFYPRFISGPIDRSNLFLPQLKEARAFDPDNITEGARLVLFGLFKKVVVANQLSLIVHGAFSTLDGTGAYNLWVVVLIQPLYLYFDFSGYTDIAIGFARAFGIKIPMNFNRPFLSENMTNFWRRFHASLSSWFSDYIFMRSMFRYRKSKLKKHATTIALFVSWILFGIWHGAGWHFMFLGLLQALAVFYEYRTKPWRGRIFSRLPAFPRKWTGRLFTYLFYSTSLVFFFAPDIKSAFMLLSRAPFSGGPLPAEFTQQNLAIVVLSIALILALEIIQEDFGKLAQRIKSVWHSRRISGTVLRWLVYYGGIALMISFSGNQAAAEFVYFQF